MADAASFANPQDLYKYYQSARSAPDFYGTPQGPSVPASGTGLRPVGPVPAKAYPLVPSPNGSAQGFAVNGGGSFTAPTAPPKPIELTDRVFHAPTPSPNGSARGLTMNGGGSFASARPVELTDRVFHPPVPSNGTTPVGVSDRGFNMGAGSDPYIDVSARPVSAAPTAAEPLQIGYKAPRVAGSGIEGMGDFATGAGEIGAVGGKGPGLRAGLRSLGGKVLGFAANPVVQTVAGLGELARAHSAAVANSDGPVIGLQRSPLLFGGPGTGRSFSANAISYTSPFTGAPQSVTQSSDQAVQTPAGGAAQAATGYAGPQNPMHGTQAWTDWQNNRNAFIAAGAVGPEDPAAPAPAGPDHGFAIVGGRKIGYNDIGTAADPLAGGKNPNGVVLGQTTNSRGLIDNIIARQSGLGGAGAQTGAPALAGGLGLTTANNFMPSRTPQSGIGAMLALGAANQQSEQHNENYRAQMESGVKQQELTLKQGELGLGFKKLESEAPYYAAHANQANAMADWERSRGPGLEAKLAATEAEKAAINETAQKRIQEASDNAEWKTITAADPSAVAQRAAVGGDLADYKLASHIAAAKNLQYKPGTPFKAGHIWDTAGTAGGWIDATTGKAVDMNALLAADKAYKAKQKG